MKFKKKQKNNAIVGLHEYCHVHPLIHVHPLNQFLAFDVYSLSVFVNKLLAGAEHCHVDS